MGAIFLLLRYGWDVCCSLDTTCGEIGIVKRKIRIVGWGTFLLAFYFAAPMATGEGRSPAKKRISQKGTTNVQERIVTYTARFDIDRVAGGKRLQASALYLDGGSTLIVGYRPISKYFEFVNKRVVVKGFHYTNPPDVQQVMADHFTITEIKLAPGETPYPQKPTALPVPPMVQNRKEVDQNLERWVRARGKLGTGRKKADGPWFDIPLTLDDGTEIEISSVYRTRYEFDYQPRIGKTVTITSKLGTTKDKKKFVLVGQMSIAD
jgi:hypothetical protein